MTESAGPTNFRLHPKGANHAVTASTRRTMAGRRTARISKTLESRKPTVAPSAKSATNA